MAAPIGNRFWELRSKHGRDKLFATPELMWQAACEYFEWCEANPFYESQAFSYQGEIQLAEIPKVRPFTLHGLCSYMDCNTAYFRVFKSQHKESANDFNTVITSIEETIYNQKFSGAASGFLNANIIARDLGLKDSTDANININKPVIIDWSDDATSSGGDSNTPDSKAEAGKKTS